MELELGLGLPNQTPMMVKGLDLNSNYNNGLEMVKNEGYNNKYNKYRNNNSVGFVDHREDEVESKDLSLLLWSGQPNEEDDDGGAQNWGNLHLNDENNDEENQEIEGWPPINSLRKEMLHHHHHHHHHGGRDRDMANHHHGHRVIPIQRNSMYVKVKMEGVPIGRKIDLRLYNSYQALTDTLIQMFAKYTENDSRDGGHYTILYQDKEGDWMLAGDVPWEAFVESVRRMEIILRNYN